jgi:Leucine-rich repeat (LRR) protein
MSSETVKIGDRLSYSEELCTVKFVGELPGAWAGEIAYGVEWDNIEKGKHNGTYKNVSYFDTTNEGKSGSFLKSSKKYDPIRGFYEALFLTYGSKVEEKEIKIGTKLVQSYGFEKLQRLQSDFNYLRNISLNRKCIKGVVESQEAELIATGLKNLEELDLSFNLFTDLYDVLTIVKHLNIKKLSLTGNRLTTISRSLVVESLESLNLTLTYPSKEVLESVHELFPNLKNLYLQDNFFAEFTLDLTQFSSLNHLDLSMNDLKTVPQNLEGDTTITSLNISDNSITLHPSSLKLPKITTLDIRRNEIKTWKDIESLNTMFPNVTELRINGNPIFDGKALEEVEYIVIAMFPNVKILNGVNIIEQERTNAELYFLSKVSQGEMDYDEMKLNGLASKHGKTFNKVKTFRNDIASNLLTLKVKNQSKVVELEVMESLEFLRLRGTISRLFDKSILDFQIAYYIGHAKEILHNDISLISSFKFEQGQILIVEDV